MNRFILFTAVLVLILIGFLVTFGLYEVKYFKTRADISQTTFSIDNSYIFNTPAQARGNGQEKIRVTIFILNSQGLGVLGKKVLITSEPTLNIETIQGVTDNYGKAYFDISSSQSKEYLLEVKADNEALTQKANLIFN